MVSRMAEGEQYILQTLRCTTIGLSTALLLIMTHTTWRSIRSWFMFSGLYEPFSLRNQKDLPGDTNQAESGSAGNGSPTEGKQKDRLKQPSLPKIYSRY